MFREITFILLNEIVHLVRITLRDNMLNKIDYQIVIIDIIDYYINIVFFFL